MNGPRHILDRCELESKCILTTVGHIEEAIMITLRTIELSHKGARGRQRVITEYKECLVRRKGNSFSDYEDELAHREIGRYEKFILIDRC